LEDYIKICKLWENNRLRITTPIKFIILAEAPISYDNYFYNPIAKPTQFLNPNDFKASNKQNLIKLFQRKGIVVVDLYPFALATFIYKQGKFNFKETGYQNALEIYYSKIIRFLRLNKKTQIILRYSGLKNRCEFKLFMQLMKRSEPDHIFKGQTANINEIKLVLKKMYSSRGRIKNLRYSRSKNKITARNFSILRKRPIRKLTKQVR
jgi:hypothetical protein